MRDFSKRIGWAIALLLTFPCAILAAFGRLRVGFTFFAQALSLVPGLPGSYLRVAYYAMTLRACSLDSHIGIGSFFAHSQASVGHRVYIGSLCILGKTNIGDRTQIASGVQILSGRRQHGRAKDGRIEGSEEGVFENIPIGSDCWIGASAIIMAAVGEGTTIGAGSVVTRAISPRSVAVGNPARVIKSTNEA
ncbi:MAG TPA: DapH/DapD/GlmU-related protein [Terracidiphilus sp.]|nr:DapH/DapD/GlmU-related protein [Terracidiphilus sp.]